MSLDEVVPGVSVDEELAKCADCTFNKHGDAILVGRLCPLHR